METLYGAWTRSSAELVTSKIGLKPYHMNGLQTTHQQLSAEAPRWQYLGENIGLEGRS